MVDLDGAKNTPQSVSIASFVVQGTTKSPVSGKVSYAGLTDGTLYPSKESMDIPAQKLTVNIQNSGYRKQAQ